MLANYHGRTINTAIPVVIGLVLLADRFAQWESYLIACAGLVTLAPVVTHFAWLNERLSRTIDAE